MTLEEYKKIYGCQTVCKSLHNKLSEIMIPPLMSSTMKGEDVLGKSQQSDKAKSQKNIGEEKTQGRPEKPDDQKSEKTI